MIQGKKIEFLSAALFWKRFDFPSVLPAEICLQSTRVQRQHEIPVDHYWNMVLDELVDLDEERLKALDVLMRQKERITKFYNKKVK